MTAVFIPATHTGNTLIDLAHDIRPRQPPTGAETAVIAKSTPAFCDRAVDVGAGESRVDTHFLHAQPKSLLQVKAVAIIAETCLPPVRPYFARRKGFS